MNQTKGFAALANGDGVEISVEPGNWSVVNTPGTAAQAIASKAAVAGVRHVCTGIFVSIACGATAQTPIKARLRDGATGAGTIIWEQAVAAPANGFANIPADGLSIVGSEGVAMTLEFEAAGVAASQESVTVTGYDLTQ